LGEEKGCFQQRQKKEEKRVKRGQKKEKLLQKGVGDSTDDWDNYGCNLGLRR